MEIKLNLTEAAFLALLSSAGIFGAGYGFGHHQMAKVDSPNHQERVVCLMPQDVAQTPKKHTAS